MSVPTISPTDVEFYSPETHSDETLRSIHARYTETWAYIAMNEGEDHPLAIEADAIAQAAITALHQREHS